MMASKRTNFLAHLGPAEWVRMRKLVIDLVLATDMVGWLAVGQLMVLVMDMTSPSSVPQGHWSWIRDGQDLHTVSGWMDVDGHEESDLNQHGPHS